MNSALACSARYTIVELTKCVTCFARQHVLQLALGDYPVTPRNGAVPEVRVAREKKAVGFSESEHDSIRLQSKFMALCRQCPVTGHEQGTDQFVRSRFVDVVECRFDGSHRICAKFFIRHADLAHFLNKPVR